MNKYLKYLLRPVSESKEPKISCVSEDDLNFLQALGNYMYEKRTNKVEAMNQLNVSLKSADRRSELFSEIRQASRDRLSNQSSLFAEVDTSNFNEEDIGGLVRSSCSWMSNIISGTTDGTVLESGCRAVGECVFEPENTLVFMPVVEKWLESYLSESEHSVAITEFLRSVQDALKMDNGSYEVIANHNPENQGKITFAK